MAWLSVFVAFVSVLAVCRITRLITEDTITKPFRDWVDLKAAPRPAARPPGRPAGHPVGRPADYPVTHTPTTHAARPAPRLWRYLDKLINCPWCAGFWVSAAVTLAYFRMWLGTWPTSPAAAFAFAAGTFAASWLSAVLADWLDSEPPPKVVQLAPAHLDVTHRQAP